MSACACMGPMRGDPMCPCAMRQAGLKPNYGTQEEQAKAAEDLRKFFEEWEVKRKAEVQ